MSNISLSRGSKFSVPLRKGAAAILLLSLLIGMLVLPPSWLPFVPTAEAVSTSVVISEFRVRGPNGAADEFVELYNLSASPVAIGGWKIRGSHTPAGGSGRGTV